MTTLNNKVEAIQALKSPGNLKKITFIPEISLATRQFYTRYIKSKPTTKNPLKESCNN